MDHGKTEREAAEASDSSAVDERIVAARREINQVRNGDKNVTLTDVLVSQAETKIILANQDKHLNRLTRTVDGSEGNPGLIEVVKGHEQVIKSIESIRNSVKWIARTVIAAVAVSSAMAAIHWINLGIAAASGK
jgi:hypothetical protein